MFAISRLCECSLPYYGVTVGLSANARPVVSQYHRQDNYGQYVYGYATDLSSQDEVKTSDGVTRGGYSYIDANGILQTVQYISDPVNGFRVLATNIPRDLPEVAHARAEHLAQFEHIKAEHATIAASRKYQPILSVSPASGSYIVPVKTHVVAPVPTPVRIQPIVVEEPVHVQHIQAAPVQAVVPVQNAVAYSPAVAVSSQYHAQDSLGQYSYGYADPNSAKSETKTADGVTRGGYSYIDANGILQTVHYISDPVNGFRVSATNLPQAPSVTLIGPKVTTTVVGPTDTNTVAADTVISSVPIHSPAVDSFAIEQKPALTQVDIVQHANVPVASPQGPYIHPNPNHETPVVYTNPELTAPFEPPHTPAHINSQVYNAPPIPVTHSQSVLYNKEAAYAAQSYNPELVHYADQSVIPAQQSFPHNQHEQQIILSGDHVPSRGSLGPHSHDQVYVQPNHPQPQQILIAPDAHSNAHLSQANGYVSAAHNNEHLGSHNHDHTYVQPHPQQVFVAQNPHTNHAYAQNYHHQQQQNQNVENQQLYITPEGHVSNHGNENQQIYLSDGTGGHGNQQVLLTSGEHRDQIYGDPNHVHAGHSIQLGPEQRANYYGAEYAAPINAEAINNGPTNQQVLNHGSAQSHSQLAYQPTDSAAYGNSASVAYDGAYGYGENPAAYSEQISAVPDGTAVPEVQQVYHQQQAPVGHGLQVAPNHEQHAFLLQQGERQDHSLQSAAHAHNAQHATATAPSGYYTQNIQY